MSVSKTKGKKGKKKFIIIGIIAFFVIIVGAFGDLEEPEPQKNANVTENATKETKSEVTEASTKEVVKSGTYDFNDISFLFSDYVNDDTSGNWKISKIASSKEVTEYAVDYYNKMFSSDDEVHIIVNFGLNTTNRIVAMTDELLDVTVQDYVENEEHSAKTLLGGTLLAEYHINIKTGKIEEIQ